MNVLIIGVGLIGGSFALALRDRGLAERIEGVEASEEHARRALERGLVDRIVTLEEGLPSADLIVLATPRSEERRVGKECRSRWSPYH